MDSLFNDIRFGFRLLCRNPGFSICVILILALGIGANSAIFSVMNALLLRPLPFSDSQRLVTVMSSNLRVMGDEKSVVSFPDFSDWRSQNRAFEEIAALAPIELNLAGEGEPERIAGFRVTPGYFSVLGVSPRLGRTFLPEEGTPGRVRVVLLSQQLWESRFGARPEIVGQTLLLDGYPHVILGVMPATSERLLQPKLWVPLALTPHEKAERGNHFLLPIARLKPGVSLDQARAEMRTIGSRLEQMYPESNSGWGVEVDGIHEGIYGPLQPVLLILLVAVGCVLLIASTNIANLLLARATNRQREIGVRSALGASRFRLIRQMLIESLVLALLGGGFGLLVTYWACDLIDAYLSTLSLPIAVPLILVDNRVLGFALLTALLAGIVFGLAPALQSSKSNVNEALKAGSRGTTAGHSRRWSRNSLVVCEMTLSLVLLIAAALLFRGFQRLLKFDPGFHAGKAISLSLTLSQGKYPDADRQALFFEQLLSRVEALPGVQSAGLTNSVPMGHQNVHMGYAIEGRTKPAPGQDLSANYHMVSPHYFSTLSIPLKQGRTFTEQDRKNSAAVVIINEALARAQWGNENPVGKRISIVGGTWSTIVGVVGDVKYFSLGVGVLPEISVPLAQHPSNNMNLVVSTAVEPFSIVSDLKREIQTLDPQQPIANIRTMEKLVADSIWVEKAAIYLMGSFAVVALFLVVLGVYGVISYSVSMRTQEIGIRMALGARPQSVLKAVLRQGLKLILLGVGLGLIISLAMTRILSSLLYGVQPTDPVTFVGVPLFLIAVALLASYVPARRASRVDPMVALRYE
jgi:putative ABC transport system permease protein